MSSFFYDVIHHSVRRRSNVLQKAIFPVFRTFDVLNVVSRRSDSDPQKYTCLRDSACLDISCVKIHPRVTSVEIKKEGLILHVFAQTLPYDRFVQIIGYLFVSWR